MFGDVEVANPHQTLHLFGRGDVELSHLTTSINDLCAVVERFAVALSSEVCAATGEH